VNDLFSSPVQWSGSVVKTWMRFWLFAVAMIAVIAVVVYLAAFDGWRAALGAAIFLAMYQLMFLYAMRRMYLQITLAQESKGYAV
jgi:hypothetical protein